MPDDVTGPLGWSADLSDEDRIRVRYSHRRGALTDIMVQLECLIDGEWLAVRRYDTHMGLHVHTAPWDPAVDRLVPLPHLGLKDAFTLAVDDRKANWERYRRACEEA